MRRPSRVNFGLALALLPAAWTPAHGASISEYFNGYGASAVDLQGLNGGSSGWNGAWTSPDTADYVPNVSNAIPAITGYSGAGNETDVDDDGAAAGGSTSGVGYRTFVGMTGTVWVSVGVRQASQNDDALFWLDKSEGGAGSGQPGREFVALRAATSNQTRPVIAYNGPSTDTNSSTARFAINTPHLFLVRVDMNVDGGDNDTIRWWIDPDLSNGEDGLGLTVGSTNGPVYLHSGADAYDATFDGIGLSGDNVANNRFDAIRVSNDANGFQFVTTGVPEPGAITLLGVAAASALTLRRRGRRSLA